MTEHRHDGGPAFPGAGQYAKPMHPGLSKREWYAGMALAGIAATNSLTAKMGKDVAALAYAMADAMLEARDA